MHIQKWILLILATTCLPHAATAQGFEKVSIKYFGRDSHVEMSEGRCDTQLVIDPMTGGEMLRERVSRETSPIAVHGKKVYSANEVTTLPQWMGKTSLEEYLLARLKKNIEEMHGPDGTLHINAGRAVIDETGKLAYYEYDGGRWQAKEGAKPNSWARDPGGSIVFALNGAPPMKPATLNGENVCAYINLSKCDYHFDIKNHVVTFKKD